LKQSLRKIGANSGNPRAEPLAGKAFNDAGMERVARLADSSRRAGLAKKNDGWEKRKESGHESAENHEADRPAVGA
jgi:hypothetical protein